MDSWNGKPIHQVNYTLIMSSPADLGVRHEEGLHFVLGMNSKRHYVKPLIHDSVNYCTIKRGLLKDVDQPTICVFYKDRFLKWLHLINAR